MAKVNVGRQGFITKSALPVVSRGRGIANVNSGLVLWGNGTNGSTSIIDSSVNNFSISRLGSPGPTISTTTFPSFASSSIFFNGSSYLQFTPNFNLSGTDYTIEWFCNFTNATAPQNPVLAQNGGFWQIIRFDLNGTVLSIQGTLNQNISVPLLTPLVNNQWYHFAIVKLGSTYYFYMDGVLQGGGTNASLNFWNTNNNIQVGWKNDPAFFNGYISNLRVTRGAALYYGNFTPPNAQLAINVNVPTWLTAEFNYNQTTDNTSNTNPIDSSTHNLTVSNAAGLVPQTQATPFAAGTGGSFRFDGVGDFLQVSGTNNQLAFGTGDFTIEAWVWIPVLTANMIIIDFRTPTNTSQPVLYYRTAGTGFGYFTQGADRIVANTTITANTWNHVAVVRISGTTRMYVNGVQQTTTYADSGNYVILADRPVIGQLSDTASLFNNYSTNSNLRGLISNPRVVKGIGVYTGNFTVPTSPLTATQSAGTNIAAISGTETSLLLNGTNYMVVDSSTNNTKGLAPFGLTYAMTGGQVNFHPYSGGGKYGSYWFDGAFSFIDSPDSADWVLTGDFTVEAWIYPTSLGQRRIVGQTQVGSATNTAWQLGLNSTNNILWEVYQGSSAVNTVSSTTISANVWTHIAVTRSGTSQTLYINGVSRGTSTLSGSSNNSTYPLRIGAAALNSIPANSVPGLVPSTTVGGPDGPWGGYITGVRVVSGTAVYTGNFTPPSIQPVDVSGAASAASYPSTTNVNTSFASSQTSLLCKFDRWTLQDNEVFPKPVYLLGTAQTSTAQAKFGAASMTGGSNLAYALTYVAAPMNIGTGNFTIQCWLYTSVWNNPQNQNPIVYTAAQNVGTSANNAQQVFINNSGGVVLDRYGAGSTTIGTINTATFTNVWFHFALVRNSGTTTCYINGTSIGSTTAWSGVTIGNLSGIFPGSKYNEGVIFNVSQSGYIFWPGFIDDFSVANSALYIGNFTPPTVEISDPQFAQNTVTNSVYGAYQNY